MANRFLSNIKVNDAYTLPASDGTNGQAITTDGSGTLSFSDIIVDEAPAVGLTVKNVSGGTLAIGTVVHPSPTASPPSGNVIEVIAADNSAASTMPAIGVLKAALADDAEGTAIALGRVSGLNTSSYTAGDALYVNTSGGFTITKPTGTALIQKIGIVIRSDASNGTIEVFGANRTNDVPNITENYIWLGNASGVATATEHLLNNVKDVTTSSPTDGQVLTWDNANSYWKNADASGGDANAVVTVEKNTFTATAAQENFTITSAPDSVNNLQVYLDGVYQAKTNYTTSGTTVTINTGTGVAVGVEVEIIHLKVVKANIELDTYTGDGSDLTFDTQSTINSENNVQVYIDGVYQSKDTYTTSGSTVTFGTGNAPPNGAAVELLHIIPTDTPDDNSVTTAKIANNAVTFDKIEDRYTAVGTITNTSGPTTVDWSGAAVYKMNAALTAAIEFDFINYKAGQVLTIYNLSGSYTVTLDSDAATSESFLKLAEQDYDGSATSILQIECLADGNDAVFAYSVAQYASDNTI